MKKTGAMLIFIASVGFILIAVIFSAFIDSTRKSRTPDSRARATQSNNTLDFLGVVDSYDANANLLIVSNLQFADTKGKPLGTFNVIPPVKFNPDSFPSGTKVKIAATPASFQIAAHQLTAKEIKK